MAFIRADLKKKNVNEVDLKTDDLTDNDIAMLALQDSDNLGPSFSYKNQSRVPIHFFGDISGLNASIAPLVSQVLADTEGDRSCELLSMNICPKDFPLKDLPFEANAAYICFKGDIYYVNRAKEECIILGGPLKRITKDTLQKFYQVFKPDQQGRLLQEDELKKVCEITGHFHNNLRPVFVYRDPNAFNGLYSSTIGKKLLEKQSETVAKLMRQQQLNGPFFMVAYSYSALLCVEVMQYLSGQNIDCCLYIIDAPSPETSQGFLLSQSPPGEPYSNTEVYAKTMLEIVNYAARLTGNDVIKSLDHKTLQTVKNLPPEKCIEALAQIIYKNKNYRGKEIFEKLIAYEKFCLDNMMNYNKVIRIPFKGGITILPTNETINKYKNYAKDGLLGWKGYAEEVNIFGYKLNQQGKWEKNSETEESNLLTHSHQEIIRHVKPVSKSIVDFFTQNMTPVNLAANRYAALKGLVDDTFGSDPEFALLSENIRYLLERKIAKATSNQNSPTSQSPQSVKRMCSTTQIISTVGSSGELKPVVAKNIERETAILKDKEVTVQHSEAEATSSFAPFRRH